MPIRCPGLRVEVRRLWEVRRAVVLWTASLRSLGPQGHKSRIKEIAEGRARLKEKHQERLASGQHVPELGDVVKEDVETSRGLAGKSEGEEDAIVEEESAQNGAKGSVSESEDVADRALRALKEMRSSAPSSDGDALEVSRRREGADKERQARRMRRRTQQASSRSGTEEKKDLDTLTEVQTPKLDGEEGSAGDEKEELK